MYSIELVACCHCAATILTTPITTRRGGRVQHVRLPETVREAYSERPTRARGIHVCYHAYLHQQTFKISNFSMMLIKWCHVLTSCVPHLPKDIYL